MHSPSSVALVFYILFLLSGVSFLCFFLFFAPVTFASLSSFVSSLVNTPPFLFLCLSSDNLNSVEVLFVSGEASVDVSFVWQEVGAYVDVCLPSSNTKCWNLFRSRCRNPNLLKHRWLQHKFHAKGSWMLHLRRNSHTRCQLMCLNND